MGNLFIHTMITYIFFIGMMNMYGGGAEDIAWKEKVILEASYPVFDEKEISAGFAGTGYIISALDYGFYVVTLVGAVVVKIGAMASMIFALTSYADALFAGFPMFTMINIIMIVIITTGFIQMIRGLT